MTVINTGREPLRAGDKVRMVIDVLDVVQGKRDASDHITGIPKSKIVARLAHVPQTDRLFADVADGLTSREINVRVDEPCVLISDIEYMGRQRYPWVYDDLVPNDGVTALALINLRRGVASPYTEDPVNTDQAGLAVQLTPLQYRNYLVNELTTNYGWS